MNDNDAHAAAFSDPGAVVNRIFAEHPDMPRSVDAVDFWTGRALAACGGTALPNPVRIVLYNRLRGPE